MRGPRRRTRSLALVLLFLATGTISHEMPPIPSGSAGQISLVLQVDAPTVGLPAPSWTVAGEGSSGFGRMSDSSRAERWRRPVGMGHRPQPDRVDPPSSSGTALLGLPFAPANAPPSV